jgi:hypothetical protein
VISETCIDVPKMAAGTVDIHAQVGSLPLDQL